MHDLEPSSVEIIMNSSMEQDKMTRTADRYKEKHFNKLGIETWSQK